MRQNFEPKIWGNHAWFFLETICMAYPTNPSKSMKSSAKNFFLSLKDLIPCEKCRNNYKQHLKLFPLTEKVLSSRDNLFMWIINVHNSIHKNKQKYRKRTLFLRNSHPSGRLDTEATKLLGKITQKSHKWLFSEK